MNWYDKYRIMMVTIILCALSVLGGWMMGEAWGATCDWQTEAPYWTASKDIGWLKDKPADAKTAEGAVNCIVSEFRYGATRLIFVDMEMNGTVDLVYWFVVVDKEKDTVRLTNITTPSEARWTIKGWIKFRLGETM